MINSEFVDDKKIKDILTYIKSMKHSEQIRMMFLCSLNGMRSINFAYLQVKDCYNSELKPKDIINLNNDKNKGKHSCQYVMNSQMKKELADYLKYLQGKWGEDLNPETYLFTSQKLNKPYNRQCYGMYSLGRASVAEITHYANMMGLRTRKGSLIHINTMHHILENPFYYGEMRTKRGLMPHVYPTLVSKELWYMCQEQKAIRAGLFLRTNDNNSLYRALITCGVTNRQCPCELKKGIYRYVTCWRKDNTRIYIREEEFTKRINPILNRIKLPDGIVIELPKELKTAKATERQFCSNEIKRLKGEQEKLKQKIDALFDMRLDGELDRETFDLKRNEIQVKLNRVKNKITTHEKADSSFDETILGLLDIATQAGYVFERSSNVDLKRLLLKFVFENITSTEWVISYKLRFPFNEFVKVTNPDDNKPLPYEPMESLADKGIEANDNENIQSGYMQFCEPKIMLKKTRSCIKKCNFSLIWLGRLEAFLSTP